jgi:hypothetical protein
MPLLVALIVTVADLAYGQFAWSWLAGPAAGLLLWSLRDVAGQPAAPKLARRHRPHALVD